eukprot:864242-Alexandrium_andersonii.AAC.1
MVEGVEQAVARGRGVCEEVVRCLDNLAEPLASIPWSVWEVEWDAAELQSPKEVRRLHTVEHIVPLA